MRKILNDIATFGTLGAFGCYMLNIVFYTFLAGFSKDNYEKISEPLDSAARNLNQYSQIEPHLSEDGLEELARLTTVYDELEEELGPSIEAASREFEGRFIRMIVTPLGAHFIKEIRSPIYYRAPKNESSE